MAPLLQIENLNLDFVINREKIHILNRVSLEIYPHEVLALIGETGCGKSVTGNAVLRLMQNNVLMEGSVRYKGRDIYAMSEEEFRLLRGREIAAIPQSPGTALNPLMKIGFQASEAAIGAKVEKDNKTAAFLVRRIFRKLGLPDNDHFFQSYPWSLSGGMCQRALISIGIIAKPNLLIVDEPTKAIDWALRREAVELLGKLRLETGSSMLFITHDISAARHIADRIAVMYCGEIVETGLAEEVINNPLHPYTIGLMNAQPSRGFHCINGFMPSFRQLPPGCRFSNRCEYADARCKTHEPETSVSDKEHKVKCLRGKQYA
ncbi:MAG: ABC transporter ATP-binding protein [Spirochaetaceae bacterium]|nr:ABC transporter ATP-binding protein [Spirochaetaceae bacterium]